MGFGGHLGKVFVDGKKKRPEAGISKQIMIHLGVLRGSWKTIRSTPRGNLDQAIRLFEGIFLRTSAKLLSSCGLPGKDLAHAQRRENSAVEAADGIGAAGRFAQRGIDVWIVEPGGVVG